MLDYAKYVNVFGQTQNNSGQTKNQLQYTMPEAGITKC